MSILHEWEPVSLNDYFLIIQNKLRFILHPDWNEMNLTIPTKFCTCHDSIAVVTCAKFCSYLKLRNGIIMKCFVHFEWKVVSKMVVRSGIWVGWGLSPDCLSGHQPTDHRLPDIAIRKNMNQKRRLLYCVIDDRCWEVIIVDMTSRRNGAVEVIVILCYWW